MYEFPLIWLNINEEHLTFCGNIILKDIEFIFLHLFFSFLFFAIQPSCHHAVKTKRLCPEGLIHFPLTASDHRRHEHQPSLLFFTRIPKLWVQPSFGWCPHHDAGRWWLLVVRYRNMRKTRKTTCEKTETVMVRSRFCAASGTKIYRLWLISGILTLLFGSVFTVQTRRLCCFGYVQQLHSDMSRSINVSEINREK